MGGLYLAIEEVQVDSRFRLQIRRSAACAGYRVSSLGP